MCCFWGCPFQQILDIKSSVKVTLFPFNKISFVRSTCPITSSLYYKLIKCICKTTLLKVDITQKEPFKSIKELELQSSNE